MTAHLDLGLYQELSARLREELDYEREAAQMRLYSAMLKDEPNIHVPEVVPELSSGRLITMSWLDGLPLMNFVEARGPRASEPDRADHVPGSGVPFYYYGIIHGDPHLGNYTMRFDGGINLLDFGCIRVFRRPSSKV